MHRFVGLLAATAATGAHGTPWPSLEFLARGSDVEVHNFVMPLAEMTKLTYTATWGSYYKKSDQNASVDGWQRGLETNPLVGMRALTFLQWNSSRGVLAFRGTDLNFSQPSGQADECADAFLNLGENHSGQLPAGCSHFTVKQLDYLSRALEFAERVAEEYPSIHWLYTGHSLGAALGELVAAQRAQPALTFSAPPLRPLLKRLVRPTLRHWGTVTLYDQYDPLRFEALGKLWGVNCTWFRAEAPEGCKDCEASTIDLHRKVCEECFLEAHTFKNYLTNVLSGRRPECSDISDILV